MKFKSLEDVLSKYTKNWTIEEGSYPASTRKNLEDVYTILSDHYLNVDKHHLDTDRESVEGVDYRIIFSDPKNKIEESNVDDLMYFDDKNPSVGPIGGALAEEYDDLSSINLLVGEENAVDESVEKHDELNQDLFDGDTLKPEVKDKLLEIVDKFKSNLKEDNIELDIIDILFVGSNASYNYTNESDIDLHIVADTSVYPDQEELAEKIYEAYKRIFNSKYDPLIYGHEVEIYVDSNENHANSNGVYSLQTGWVKKPDNDKIPEISDELLAKLEDLVNDYKDKYSNVDEIKTVEEVDNAIDEIYKERQSSILKDGEYGIGNLLFKEIRNCGLLKALKDRKIELENEAMSLTEESIFKKAKNAIGDLIYDDEVEEDVFDISEHKKNLLHIMNTYSDYSKAIDACLRYLVDYDEDVEFILTHDTPETRKYIDDMLDYLYDLIDESKIKVNDRNEFFKTIKSKIKNFKVFDPED